MLQVDISASPRDTFGKGAMRRLRVSGSTPAVLYGNNKDVMALQLNTKAFVKSLHSISRKNAVVNLSIGDDLRHVMMREVQTDPVTDSLIHADFYEINLDAPRTFTVKIDIVGKAKGVDKGGELILVKPVIVLEGAPLDIPDSITLDVTELDSGQAITFADIAIPDGVKMVSSCDTVCVEVISAKAAAALAAAEEAAAQSEEEVVEDSAEGAAEGEGADA